MSTELAIRTVKMPRNKRVALFVEAFVICRVTSKYGNFLGSWMYSDRPGFTYEACTPKKDFIASKILRRPCYQRVYTACFVDDFGALVTTKSFQKAYMESMGNESIDEHGVIVVHSPIPLK